MRTDIQMPAILTSRPAQTPCQTRSGSALIHSGLRYESLTRFHDGNEPLLVDYSSIEWRWKLLFSINPNVARPGNFKSMEVRTMREPDLAR